MDQIGMNEDRVNDDLRARMSEADAARMEHWLMGHACELAAAGLDVAAIRQDARDLGSRAAAAGQDFFRRWLTGVFTA